MCAPNPRFKLAEREVLSGFDLSWHVSAPWRAASLSTTRWRTSVLAILIGGVAAAFNPARSCSASEGDAGEPQDVAQAPLPVDAITSASPIAIDASTLEVGIIPTPGFALYVGRLRFTSLDDRHTIVRVGLEAPADSSSRTATAPFNVRLKVWPPLDRAPMRILMAYQGCNLVRGICLQPATRVLAVQVF